MIELNAENIRGYLIGQGHCLPTEKLTVETLAGGVSNLVLKISPEGKPPFVLKQSRAQLRTKADWFSRLDRIFREAEAQRALVPRLSPGSVPAVLFEDRDNYCFAMQAIENNPVVWKSQLLSGLVNPAIFQQAGNMLADLHLNTVGQKNLMTDADETTVFYELRIDPFYHRIQAVHPVIQPAIQQMIDDMRHHAVCLVHADFSPKNLLVHAEGLALVDYETVHYGDPAFDIGFFFSHLWLKALALPDVRERMLAGIELAFATYQARIVQSMSSQDEMGWVDLSRRSVPHLAGCLLARVDGKSPVDYLQSESQKRFVRELAVRWLTGPPSSMDTCLAQFGCAVRDFASPG